MNERVYVQLKDTAKVPDREMYREYADYSTQLKKDWQQAGFTRAYLPQEIQEQYQDVREVLTQHAERNPAAFKKSVDALIRDQKLEQKYGTYVQAASQGMSGYLPSKDDSKAVTSFKGRTVDAFGLDYMIAESLQQIYSEQDPRAEYYDWIKQQHDIEVNINTGGTTEEEIVERNAFISFLDDRETEIKRIMVLYAGAAFNSHSRQQAAAQEKLKFLVFKLSELRRLREKTQNTKSQADSKEYFEEQEKRQRDEARRLTMGAATAGYVAMSLAEQRLNEKVNAAELENSLGDRLLYMKPDTQTKEQVYAKINATKHNRNLMAKMIMKMRGLEVNEDTEEENVPEMPLRKQIRQPRGFVAREYNQYTAG